MSVRCTPETNKFKYSLVEKKFTLTNVWHVTKRLHYRVSQINKLKCHAYFMKLQLCPPSDKYMSFEFQQCFVEQLCIGIFWRPNTKRKVQSLLHSLSWRASVLFTGKHAPLQKHPLQMPAKKPQIFQATSKQIPKNRNKTNILTSRAWVYCFCYHRTNLNKPKTKAIQKP